MIGNLSHMLCGHHLSRQLLLSHLLHHLLPFWPHFLRTHPCLSSRLSTSSVFIIHRLAARTSRLTLCWLISHHSLFKHCNSLHGSSIILGDFSMHYDNPLNPTTSRVMDLLTTFNLTQAVSQPTHDKGHDWLLHASDDHLVQSTSVWYHRLWPHLHHLPPQHRRSSLPAYIHHDMKYLHHRPCCPESRPVHVSLLAPVLMTGLCADWHPWRPCSWLCAAVHPQKKVPWFSSVAEEVWFWKQQRHRAERLWLLKTGLTVHKQLYSNVKTTTCNQTSSQRQNYLLLE